MQKRSGKVFYMEITRQQNMSMMKKHIILTRILTTRNNGADIMQDLNYTFDPVSNITAIVDDAQQTIFFNNAAVDPSINMNMMRSIA